MSEKSKEEQRGAKEEFNLHPFVSMTSLVHRSFSCLCLFSPHWKVCLQEQQPAHLSYLCPDSLGWYWPPSTLNISVLNE